MKHHQRRQQEQLQEMLTRMRETHPQPTDQQEEDEAKILDFLAEKKAVKFILITEDAEGKQGLLLRGYNDEPSITLFKAFEKITRPKTRYEQKHGSAPTRVEMGDIEMKEAV